MLFRSFHVWLDCEQIGNAKQARKHRSCVLNLERSRHRALIKPQDVNLPNRVEGGGAIVEVQLIQKCFLKFLGD